MGYKIQDFVNFIECQSQATHHQKSAIHHLSATNSMKTTYHCRPQSNACQMEAVIFCGIQASGKSTFFKERFFKTHVRISLDMLKTRNREDILLAACLEAKQPFVVDNTNPSKADRAKYITAAKAKKFKVIGYYFATSLDDALERNRQRQGKENIPEVGVKGTLKRLEKPSRDEGFDQLFLVKIENNSFTLQDWNDEI
jgi:predicted kinase